MKQKSKLIFKNFLPCLLSLALIITVGLPDMLNVSAARVVTDDFSSALDAGKWTNTSSTSALQPTVSSGILTMASSGTAFGNLTYFSDSDRSGRKITSVSFKVRYGTASGQTLPSGIGHTRLVYFYQPGGYSTLAGADTAFSGAAVGYTYARQNPYPQTNITWGNSDNWFFVGGSLQSGAPTGAWVTYTLNYDYSVSGKVTITISGSCQGLPTATKTCTVTLKGGFDPTAMSFGFTNATTGALPCSIDDVSVHYLPVSEDILTDYPVLSEANSSLLWSADKAELIAAKAAYEALGVTDSGLESIISEKFTAACENQLALIPTSIADQADLKLYFYGNEAKNRLTALGVSINPSVTETLTSLAGSLTSAEIPVLSDDFSDADYSAFLWTTNSTGGASLSAATSYTGGKMTLAKSAIAVPTSPPQNVTTISNSVWNGAAKLAELKYTINYSGMVSGNTASRQYLSYNGTNNTVNNADTTTMGTHGGISFFSYAPGTPPTGNLTDWKNTASGDSSTVKGIDITQPVTVTVTYDSTGLTESGGTLSGTLKMTVKYDYTKNSTSDSATAVYNMPVSSITPADLYRFGFSETGMSAANIIDDVQVALSYGDSVGNPLASLTVDGNAATQTDTASYAYEAAWDATSVNINATAAEGATIKEGSQTGVQSLTGSSTQFTITVVSGSSEETGYTLTVTKAAAPTYAVTASASAGGTVSPDTEQSVSHGNDVIYTINPTAGYFIKDIKVNTVSVGQVALNALTSITSQTSYTVSNVTGNTAISVEFSKALELLDGAAVRMVEPTGLRFSTKISKEFLDALTARGATGFQFGTILLPTDLLTSSDFTTANYSNVLNVKQTVWGNEDTLLTDSYYLMNGVIANIKTANINRAISGRGYVTVTYSGGASETIYSNYEATYNSRSVKYVAGKAIEDDTNYANEHAGTHIYTTEQLMVLHSFAD